MAKSVDVLLELVTDALEGMKGKDIVQLDVRGLSSVTDYMVIATGTSNRHVKSLAEEVSFKAKQSGFVPLGVEGEMNSDWVLADLGDVIVHVMQTEAREFYDLERLWDPALQDEAPAVLLADD
ncbi:MAG: ribosome silencing factor [Gammaproteobacteria bacterium]|jgi:ribosome-associated protein|nr:ribosome silencing factor [Gammaproteobacteria bacterium]MCP4880989.1 ribosome silencing factor [Gammaproteobacteria bacterium]MDP6166019.1 ribosome silencing factor [Gammaproteobacteria bacterium]